MNFCCYDQTDQRKLKISTSTHVFEVLENHSRVRKRDHDNSLMEDLEGRKRLENSGYRNEYSTTSPVPLKHTRHSCPSRTNDVQGFFIC